MANNEVKVSANAGVVEASNKPTNFQLNIDPAQVKGTYRSGNDLVIELEGGKKKKIQNFFKNGENFHQLEIAGEAVSPGSSPELADVAGAGGLGDLGAILPIGLLALAGLAATSGGGGGSKGGSSTGGTDGGEAGAPTPTPELTTNPDGSVNVGGKAAPGSQVVIQFPDGTTTTVPADSQGNYSAKSLGPQKSGKVVVQAKAPDGTTTTKETNFADTKAPDAPGATTTTANPNGTLKVSGTAEPGSTVKVTFPDGTTKTVTPASDGTYSVTSDKPQGSGTVSVTATDAAGNTSTAATKTVTDTSAPLVPTGTTTTQNPNGTLTVAGSAEPGSQVKVTFPDGTSKTVTADPTTGGYTATSTSPQTSGPVSVTATDSAGNTSPSTGTTVTDTTAPLAPTGTTVTPNTNGTLTVAGKAEPGSSVKVTFPDGTTKTVAADPVTGNYTATSTAPQTSGPVSVKATDLAGNVSPATTATFTDTSAPAAPAAPTTTANPNGTLTVGGTTEPGSQVKVTFPDGTTKTVTADPVTGTYTATSATPQAPGTVSVTATDPAGNTSPTTTKTVTDATAPVAPTGTTTTPNANGTLTVAGTAEPGSQVKVTFPDGTTKTVTADPTTGAYTATSAAPQPSGPVSVTATDPAGNTSPAATSTFTDTTAPTAPPAPSVTTNPTGTLTVSGTAEPGSQVKVTFPDGTSATVVASPTGAYSATSAAPQTTGTVSVAATDAAGNTSPVTTKPFTDTTAPTAPTASTTQNPSGTLTVTGTAEPGSQVAVNFPDGTTKTVTANATGTYTATSTTPQTTGSVSVKATDAAGNTSPATTTPFTDTSAPSALAAPTTTQNPNGTLTVGGTAEPGSQVKVTFPDGTTKTVAADPVTGSYTATSAAPQGTGTVSVAATDPAGNTSPVTTKPVTDTTAPTAPTGTTVTPNANGTLTVAGSAEPGSQVAVTFPDGTTKTVTADPTTGAYTATSASPQTSGPVSVTATDPAGNTSPAANTPFVDAVAPAAPTGTTVTPNTNGTLTVAGKAEPGSSVKVTFPDGTTKTVTADPVTGNYTATSAAPQTTGPVAITATDSAGNTSPAAAATYNDATPPTAPAAPTTTANPNGTLTVGGTTEPGSQVKVTFPDGTTKTVTADPVTGAYTATSAGPQPSGTVSVTATDPAGNTSPTTTKTVTDATAPVAPTGTTTTPNANGTLTVAGTAEPGSQVKVTFPDGTTKTVTADPTTGAYTATSAAPQPSGPVSVTATDPVGNTSPAATSTFTDTNAPTAPVAPSVTTNPTGTLTASGTAEPGSQVKVTFPDGTSATVVASPTGAYSATSAAPQTTGTVSVAATDAAGNTSPVTTKPFTDTTAPTAPTASTTQNPSGTLTVAGTAEPGSQVKVTFPDGTTQTVTAAPNGSYTATSPTPQTSGAVSVAATDAAGNVSPATVATFADTTAPNAPSGLTTTANSNGTVTASGSAEPGSQVTVTFPDGTTKTVTADPTTGAFTATSAAAQPTGNVTASAKDAAGNASPAASSGYVDTTAPVQPTLSTAANPDGTITVSGTAEPGSSVKVTFPDGSTATVVAGPTGAYTTTSPTSQPSGAVTVVAKDAAGNPSPAATSSYTDATAPGTPTVSSTVNPDGTIKVSGTAEPGSTVTVTYPDGTTATVVAGPTGAYTATSAAIQPSGTVTASAKDAAGNTSPVASTAYSDTTAPTAPTAAVTGNPNGTVTVSGAAEPGSTVKVTFPDGTTGTAVAGPTGAYSVTSPGVQPTGTVSVTAKDPAGNASPATTTSFADTTAPASPTTGVTANPNGTITVAGTAEPGSQVKVTYPDGTTSTVTADPTTGAYSATSTTAQPSGNVSVTAKDAAGNQSPAATSAYADAIAPGAPTVASASNPDGTVTVSGTAEPGSQVKVTFPDGTTKTVTAGVSGAYSATSLTPQPTGSITASATDLAGNTSGPTTAAFADTTPPAKPIINSTSSNPDGTMAVSGTAEPNSTVKVTFPDGTSKTVVAGPSGAFSAASTTVQPSGTVQANATDAAGNTSLNATAPFTDTAAPSVPTLSSTANPDGTLKVSGTAEPGSSVKVTFPDGTTATVTADPTTGAYSATSATPQPSGPVKAAATDPAGNTSPAATSSYADATAPSQPTVTTTANPDGTLKVSGIAEPGSTVKVTFPDGTIANVVAGPTGAYTATSLTPQPTGTVTASAKDAAGNTSPNATASYTDSTPPAAPTVTTTQNPDGTLKVSGNAEPGSNVTVTFPDGTTATVVANASGVYSATSTTNQPSGTVKATATDAAGNISPATTAPFTDTAAPAAPTLSSTANPDGTLKVSGLAEPGSSVKVTFPDGTTATVTADPTTGAYSATSATPQPSGPVKAAATDTAGNAGPNATGSYSDTTAPSQPTVTTTANPDGTLKVSGIAEPGSTVKVTFPDGTIANVVAGPTGAYSATSLTPQPTGTVTASAKDAAGNTSPNATTSFTDTTAPAAPTLTTTPNGNGTVTVSGLAEPGSSVKVTFPDGSTATVVAGPTGAYTATSATNQPSGPVKAAATDAAGNTSPNATGSYTDTVAPTAPTLASTANPDGTVKVSGTAEPGSSVKVTFPDGTTATVTADPTTGAYSATSATPQPSGPVKAAATDAAGNVSPNATGSYADTTAPAAPTVTPSANPNGTVTAAGIAEPGAIVTVTFPDGTTVNAVAGPTGVYSATSAANQPSGAVSAVAKDAAGNTSAAGTGSYTDTIAPAAPTLTATGNPDGTLTATGTAEPNSSVKVTFPDGTTKTVVASATGAYSATSTTAQPSGTVTAQAKDAAGNTSPNATQPFTDTVAPAAPTITSLADDVAAVTGTIAANASTNDAKPTLTGTAEPGSTVKIYDGATLLGSALVDNAGAWTYTPPANLAEGTHQLTVKAVDTAGNISDPVSSVSFKVDTIAPSAPVFNLSDGTVITGTAEPGATVKVDIDGDNIPDFTTTADPVTGVWSVDPPTDLLNGVVVTATSTDAAGNISPAGTTTIKSGPDQTATITNFTDNVAALTGNFGSGTLTNDATPVLNGTVSAALTGGEVVRIYDGTTLLGTATVTGTTWTFAPPTLADGSTHNYKAVVTDTANKEGTPSSVFSLSVDTSPPTQAVTITNFTDNVGGATGNFGSGTATDDTTPQFNGTLSAPLGVGETLKIYEGGVVLGTAVVTGTTWTFTSPTLSGGIHQVTGMVSDTSGNLGPKSNVFNVNIPATIIGAQAQDGLGYDIGTAGDFNGDGYADLIVSAPHDIYGTAVGLQSDMYIVYGSAAGLPALTNIDAMTAAQGLKINNAGTTGDAIIMGLVATTAGDINGDGYSDVILSSHIQDSAYVIFGRNAGGSVNLSSMNSSSTTDGFRIRNWDTGLWFGSGAGGGSDVNGDGYSDIVIGSLDTFGNGMWNVLYGHAGAAGSASWTNLQARYVGFFTDMNTPTELAPNTHSSIISLTGPGEANADLGAAVQTIGDVNADGFDDYLVAAPRASSNSIIENGRVYLVYGSAAGFGPNFNTTDWSSSLGVRIAGSENYESLGSIPADFGDRSHGDAWYGSSNTLAGLGDINGDGIADFAIGSPLWGDGALDGFASGRIYVVYGKAGGWSDFSVTSLTGTNGFILEGGAGLGTNALLGNSIRSTGDVNGDGIDDFLVGAPNADTNGLTDNGAVYLVFGKDGGGFTNTSLEAMVASGDAIRFDGADTDTFMGTNVGMGDWNGDGIQDLAVPSWEGDVGAANAGGFDIYYGSTGALTQGFTSGADTLTGSAGVDNLSGGQGGDTINSIGTGDVALGGAGNDTISISATDFVRIDGGLGLDTLKIDAAGGLTLDFADLGLKVQGFEQIDLNTGNNTIKIAQGDLLRLLDQSGTAGKPLTILGDAGDTVEFTNDGGRWVITGTVADSGKTFDVYGFQSPLDMSPKNSIRVEQGITVTSNDVNAVQRISGVQANDGLGYDIGTAGDFNGDGYEDLIVSATHGIYGANAALQSDIYVMFGDADGLPRVFNPDEMTAAQGVKIDNVGTTGDVGIMGLVATTAGDLNGDGYSDVIMGSVLQDSAYVIFGRNTGGSIDLSSMNSAATNDGFRIRNWDTGGWLGTGIGSQDINADGYSDILLGSSDANGSGMYFVLNGHAGAGGSAGWGNLQARVAGFYTDTASPTELAAGSHSAVVTLTGTGEADSDFGNRAQSVGDVNSDGFVDYVVTAPRADSNGFTDNGRAYLVYGTAAGFGPNFNTADWSSEFGVRLAGTQNWEQLGGNTLDYGDRSHGDGWYGDANSVAGIGDFNGDGIADFAIGSPEWGDGAFDGFAPGRIYVVYGKEGGWSDFSLSTLDGTNGFILEGGTGAGTNALLGNSIRSTGDVNGDGLDDFLVGAPNADSNGLTDNGAVYLVYGKAGGLGNSTLDTLISNGEAKKWTGRISDDFMGTNVGMGDWNGDGLQDLAIPSWESDLGGDNVGSFDIHYGSNTNLTASFTRGDDSIGGTGADDRISGGQGNDTISGISTNDVAYGGAGNDTIEIDAIDFARIDGGLGLDTLKTTNTTGLTLDFADLGLKAQGFERIDLATGNNTLKIAQGDLLRLLDQSGTTGKPLTILGGAGDTVEFANDGGRWVVTGTATDGGKTFDVYGFQSPLDMNPKNSIRVEQGISVTSNDINAVQRISGVQANDGLGYDIGSAGDFNGDGYEDLIVSATHGIYGLHAGLQTDVYVMFGDADGLPRVFNPDELTAAQGVKINNTGTTGDQGINGLTATTIGDINGDGYSDVMMASALQDNAYVIFGRASGGTINLSSMNSGATTDGFRMRNGDTLWFGSGGGGNGDFNGDGYDDILIGDIDSAASGAYYVLNGHAGAGGSATWDNLIAYNNGLRHDVFLGAELSAGTHTRVGTSVLGEFDSDLSAHVQSVGDVNNDGFDDYIATAPRADLGATFDAGRAYLVYGSAAGLGSDFDLNSWTAAKGIRMTGSEIWETLGGSPLDYGDRAHGDAWYGQSNSIAGIGDVNGDGIADFAIGSPEWGDTAADGFAPGRVYVVYGKESGLVDFSLGSLNGTNGFILAGGSGTGTNALLGNSIRSTGDVNGDGLDDFLVSAPNADVNGLTDNGAVYLVHGKAGGYGNITLDTMITDGDAERWTGRIADEFMGTNVGMGDWNGDGLQDLAIPSWQSDIGGNEVGSFDIRYGSNTNLTATFTRGDDIIAATASDDRISGGQGNDTITGVGTNDVAYGGSGNDTIEVSNTSFARVNGGLGEDILKVTGSGINLDLSNLALKVQGFESVDLNGSGANTLNLSLSDILHQKSAVDLSFTVLGGTDDTVQLVNGSTGSWSSTGTTQTIGGQTFDVYHHSSHAVANAIGNALIDQDVQVQVI